ncbi:MAG: glycosyltransferase [Sphingobacteriales bacterium]|nr:glycosyltransferase [Sphingobacteriales bacterium]MBI3718034.1 glycosyltransferase [Sphingobacteriales bacterium]
MKILWLAHEGFISGANNCLFEYIEILEQKGINNIVIVPMPGAMENLFQSKDISVYQVKFYPWSSTIIPKNFPYIFYLRRWVRNWYAVAQIKKIIKEINPDYVATNTIVTPVAAKAAASCRKKHIWFVHEFGEEDHGYSIAGNFKRGARLINKLSSKIVFNSLAVQNKFTSYVDKRKAIVVYNIAKVPETVNHYPDLMEKLRLIMLGRMAPSKNQLEAIRALAICHKKGLNFELNITGEDADEEYLRVINTTIAELGLTEKIRLTGPMLNPGYFLGEHHALLMCSRMEAFGRVTVEALKMGVPVIAANTGGSLEIIRDGADGYFYQSGNAQDLADKILLLYNNYWQFNKETIAVSARQRFNESKTAAQLMQIFN